MVFSTAKFQSLSIRPPTPPKDLEDHDKDAEADSKKAGRKNTGRVTIETVRRAINEATSSPLQLCLRASWATGEVSRRKGWDIAGGRPRHSAAGAAEIARVAVVRWLEQ